MAAAQPFNYVPAQRAAYERDAALGLSHVLFAKSPGGVAASARRTAHWRPIIDRVARAHRLDPDMLEAIVMLESAGRADARASDDLRSAAGLTQILAETGQNLLGLHIDVKASERLTRGILRGHRVAAARGRSAGASTSASTRPRRSRRRRAIWTSPRASSAATTSPSSPTTWASATCSRR